MKGKMAVPLIRALKELHFFVSAAMFAFVCQFFYGNFYSIYTDTKRYLLIVAAYMIVLVFMRHTYSVYSIDLSTVGKLIYSQTMSHIVSGGAMYILFFVDYFDYTFVNPLPIISLVFVQLLWNCVWSYAANKVYFKLFKQKRSVMIYRNKSDFKRLQEVYNHKNIFKIEKLIENPDEDIYYLIEETNGYDAIFVAGISASLRNGIIKSCIDRNIPCYIAPHVGDVILMGAEHIEQFSVPVFCASRKYVKGEYALFKRSFDIFASLLGIIITSPLMLLTAVAVRTYDGGPALYKQTRLTKNSKEFKILKFRSMKINAESDGVARLAAENDSRITPIGKVIRACRLDELPQLFNILKGDMSFVGPRPERPEIAEQYENKMHAFNLRLQVRAGLTGFAQVYGKYNTDPYDKLQMDLMYINNMSPILDLKMLLATFKILFVKDSTSGIEAGCVTASDELEEKTPISSNG